MSDLSFERCEKLAGWGLPQELEAGDRYWGFNNDRGRWTWRTYRDEELPSEYYKIPTLEELMDFARTFDEEWCLRPQQYSNREPGWRLTRPPDFWWDDDDPKQVAYKLIEKHFEKVKG